MKMFIEAKTEYMAVKINGLSHFIWFEVNKVKMDDIHFEGVGGWGKNGQLTEIKTKTNEINSLIYSDSVQYE